MPRLSRGSLAVLAAVAMWMQVSQAAACNYDGKLGANFAVKYPRAVEVATALRDRSNAQLLDAHLVAPTFVNMMGYHRAVRRLQRLRDALERAVHDRELARPGFSLLLVESGLWSRYAPDATGVSIAVHTAGPELADALIFTGEAVIEAIASGRLSVDEAFRRGLIVVDGTAGTDRDPSPLLRAALTMLADRL
jgi:hypothetical protein